MWLAIIRGYLRLFVTRHLHFFHFNPPTTKIETSPSPVLEPEPAAKTQETTNQPQQTTRNVLRQPPPPHLLDLRESQAPQQAITVLNDQKSRLLDLPPEIRLVIFEYVLRSWAIHVTPFPKDIGRKPRVHFCANPEGCPDASPPSLGALRRCDKSWFDIAMKRSSADRHEKCQRSSGTDPVRPRLDVLLVSRRIYEEMALIPFQKNTFTIHLAAPFANLRHPTFQCFLDSLAHEQREALAHITVTSSSCFLESNKGQIARLKRLRTLHIIQTPSRGLGSMYDAISSSLEHAGGRPREWRRLELQHLDSVQVSQEVRLSKEKHLWEVENEVFCAQTLELNRLLDIVEVRLFESIAKRPMPVANLGVVPTGEGVESSESFEERLRRLRH